MRRKSARSLGRAGHSGRGRSGAGATATRVRPTAAGEVRAGRRGKERGRQRADGRDAVGGQAGRGRAGGRGRGGRGAPMDVPLGRNRRSRLRGQRRPLRRHPSEQDPAPALQLGSRGLRFVQPLLQSRRRSPPPGTPRPARRVRYVCRSPCVASRLPIEPLRGNRRTGSGPTQGKMADQLAVRWGDVVHLAMFLAVPLDPDVASGFSLWRGGRRWLRAPGCTALERSRR